MIDTDTQTMTIVSEWNATLDFDARDARVTWADGYGRCFRYRADVGNSLASLDGSWQDCANVPFNPTPPPGP